MKDAGRYEPKPEQSLELLKALHIVTRDGRINQDTRRKLKQVQHLLGFIEPLLRKVSQADVHLVDHGAGKSYLGFLLYDAFFKQGIPNRLVGTVTGIESRAELVNRSAELAQQFGFTCMRFVNAAIADTLLAQADTAALSATSLIDRLDQLPARVDIVTALHACDTATDDAIAFGLAHQAQHMVLVPCCQAEVAACLRANKTPRLSLQNNPLAELWRRPIHTREFGSQLTNVLRCLRLEAHGYEVTVTELVGWEHSMKNELIVASLPSMSSKVVAKTRSEASVKLTNLLELSGLGALHSRFA